MRWCPDQHMPDLAAVKLSDYYLLSVISQAGPTLITHSLPTFTA